MSGNQRAFQVSLLVATLLVTLCIGLLGTFAVIIMPGIATLDDLAFLQAFQVMDGVIQNNQPIFVLTWVGSVLSIIVTAILAFQSDPQPAFLFSPKAYKWILTGCAVAYIVGVQVVTAVVHLPRNNRVHALDLDEMDEDTAAVERQYFESTWNQWNIFRTVVGLIIAEVLLLTLFVLDPSKKGPTSWNRNGESTAGVAETYQNYNSMMA